MKNVRKKETRFAVATVIAMAAGIKIFLKSA